MVCASDILCKSGHFLICSSNSNPWYFTEPMWRHLLIYRCDVIFYRCDVIFHLCYKNTLYKSCEFNFRPFLCLFYCQLLNMHIDIRTKKSSVTPSIKIKNKKVPHYYRPKFFSNSRFTHHFFIKITITWENQATITSRSFVCLLYCELLNMKWNDEFLFSLFKTMQCNIFFSSLFIHLFIWAWENHLTVGTY